VSAPEQQRLCPRCAGTGFIADETDAALEGKIAELLTACRVAGIPVSVTSTVTETDASRLVDRAPTTLANWRYANAPIPFRKKPRSLRAVIKSQL
jgi:hypothetical protein